MSKPSWMMVEKRSGRLVILVRTFTEVELDDDGTKEAWEREQEEGWLLLPAHYVVCGYCNGTGGSSAYLGAFTMEEWEEQGPDFQEDYMAGVYDRPCPECEGWRVIAVPDDSLRNDPRYAKAWEAYDRNRKDDAEEAAMYRAEMRLMGDY